MKTYETLLQNEKNFVSTNETRNAQCINKRTRLYVSAFEEIFSAITNDERVALFDAEYSDTKTRDKSINVTYARVIDKSDNKSVIQLYGKENGKTFDVVFTVKYHDAFKSAFEEKYKERFKYDSAHCIKYCAYEEIPQVINTIFSVLNAEKHASVTVEKKEEKKVEVKKTSKKVTKK